MLMFLRINVSLSRHLAVSSSSDAHAPISAPLATIPRSISVSTVVAPPPMAIYFPAVALPANDPA
jgi:hypothetical protein